MKLRLIREFEEIQFSNQQELIEMSPDNLLNTRNTQPFIYSEKLKRIEIGKRDYMHEDILADLKVESKNNKAYVPILNNFRAIYYQEASGIVGRIGHQIPIGNREGSLVCCYETDYASAELFKEAIKLLYDRHLVKEKTIVVYDGKLSTVPRFLGDATIIGRPSEERRERAKYQIALHLGAWPDGRRLSPDERKAIKKMLGYNQEIIKQPWQSAIEKAGLIQPGQKWWAMTSESRLIEN